MNVKNINKIIDYNDYNLLRSIKKPKVIVGGCFDLLHYGHIQFLNNVKKGNEILIVALESDEFILLNKKRKPIHNQKQRAKILASLICIDYVLLLPLIKEDFGYFQMIKKINPQTVAITYGDRQLKNKKNQIETVGGKLRMVIKEITGFSSQQIINKFCHK